MKQLKSNFFLFAILIMSANTLFSQTSISGLVVDQDGQPIPGVTILDSSNEQNGTVTDFDGNFTINVPSNGTLNISYIGYKTQSVDVSGQTNLSISLEESVSALDEVVITGYGSQVKKSDLTGSIASIGAEDFESQPLVRVDQALQARAAGVAVTQTSGAPGAGYEAWILKIPSLWGYQLIWWFFGIGLVWFLASKMDLSTLPNRPIQANDLHKQPDEVLGEVNYIDKLGTGYGWILILIGIAIFTIIFYVYFV